MTQLQLPIVEGVAAKLDRILALTNGSVKRASDVTFTEANYRNATAKALRDSERLPTGLVNKRPVYHN